LGQGLLVKEEEDGLYESYQAEGGHVDFSVKGEEDWELT